MLLFQEIFQLNLRYGSVLVFPFEFKVITLETKVVDMDLNMIHSQQLCGFGSVFQISTYRYKNN